MKLRTTALRAHSGSPSPGEPEYLLVGTLRRPHGLAGDVVMKLDTDFPDRLKPGVEVLVGAEHRKCVIAACRPHAEGLLIRFDGTDTPEAAGTLRNQAVYVSAANRPVLPAGQYYHHQLLGSEVFDEQGVSLGQLNEILQTGANDVYIVLMDDQRELLLPAIDSVILQVDIDARTMRIRVPPGLEPEQAATRMRPTPGRKKRNAKRG